jgi:two-component system chemotaxis response regulator CheB
MPKSALEYVEPDYIAPAREIGPLLTRLVQEERPPGVPVDSGVKVRLGKEVDIAKEGNAFKKGFMHLGQLAPYTCPECNGALVRVTEGQLSRFRCHTGHAFTDNALLESVMAGTAEQLWEVMRRLEEGVMLLNEMAQRLEASGDRERVKVFQKKANELEKRSRRFHEDVLQHETLSADNLGMTEPAG